MSFWFDLLKAFGFGTMAFLAGPIVAALLPWSQAKRVVGLYQTIAMSLMGRAVMLKRSHGGLKLKKSSFDPAVGAEKLRIGREEKHFHDPHGYMSTFKGYPFGLAHEDRAAIVDARTAYLSRRFADLVANDRFERDGMLKAFFSVDIDAAAPLVDLSDILATVQQSAEPGMPTRQDTYAEKANALFDNHSIVEQAQWFMALGVGFGLMWLASEALVRGGGGGGGSVIPMFLGVVP